MDCTCHSYHRTQLPIPYRAGNTANRGYSCHSLCINGHYSAYPFPKKRDSFKAGAGQQEGQEKGHWLWGILRSGQLQDMTFRIYIEGKPRGSPVWFWVRKQAVIKVSTYRPQPPPGYWKNRLRQKVSLYITQQHTVDLDSVVKVTRGSTSGELNREGQGQAKAMTFTLGQGHDLTGSRPWPSPEEGQGYG